jgi:hypothetical protein
MMRRDEYKWFITGDSRTPEHWDVYCEEDYRLNGSAIVQDRNMFYKIFDTESQCVEWAIREIESKQAALVAPLAKFSKRWEELNPDARGAMGE